MKSNTLHLKNLGIDTYKEAVIYMRSDCEVCLSEGFEVHARVRVTLGDKSILATLNTIEDSLLDHCQASLSKYAWQLLDAKENDEIQVSHPKPLQSLSFVRSKIYGNVLEASQIQNIIEDVSEGHYSGIHISAFLTACAGGRLNDDEIIHLTQSMVSVGERLFWENPMVVDKHCVGGLPGNRTTLIVVPIVAAFGLMMPKTSSRAITSPAGTADTMEVLAPVELSLSMIRKVVERENGCIVWGGSVALSPADDILLRVERAMDLDSEGQLIASVLSKKISAGSSHIAIDIPVGPTAKVRSTEMANEIERLFNRVSQALGVTLSIDITDGWQPVGRGIGPALEAMDVLEVLQNKSTAPVDLKDRALNLSGMILEFSPDVKKGNGKKIATKILESGEAWKKFQAICDAQGGMRVPRNAPYSHVVESKERGCVTAIDNRLLSRIAKLAGAPQDKSAGVVLHTPLHSMIENDQPLFTVYAESKGELRYALSMLDQVKDIIQLEVYE